MSALSSRTAVILDGHPLWLDALAALLERLELAIVGRATTVDEARELVYEHRPDLFIADFAVLDGEEQIDDNLLMHARRANSSVKCVVLSETDDARARDQAFQAGAAAFCVKKAEPDDLAVAIRQSFEHSIYFATGRAAPDAPAAPRNGNDDESRGLTKREIEILRLAAEGHSNSQVARMLWVTEQTVKFHLSNIYRKLDVANRTEASHWAYRNGLLNVEAA